MNSWDAIVIGSGPNGLSAAVSIASAGHSVLIIEAAEEIGGGTRTLPLTLPGFLHDVCSSIHPLAVSSPAFATMPLGEFGLTWVHPEVPLAHPLDGGRAVILDSAVSTTAAGLEGDRRAYERLFTSPVLNWALPSDWANGVWRMPKSVPELLDFAVSSARSITGLLASRFRNSRTRALFAGLAAHSSLPLDAPFTAGFALFLAAAGHAVGWPFPRGGSRMIASALAGYLRTLGVQFETGVRVNSLDELPPHRIVLCDTSPRELERIAGSHLPDWYRRKLLNFKYGPGVFKVDWALDGAIPWSSRDCDRAGTIHVGGTAEEIAASEQAVSSGKCAEKPFVILAQHTRFDATRAPAGKHTAWGYCHVPNGSETDMTDRIERQIERFAPGFRDRILARSALGPAALQAHNPNLIGGDIYGGANNWQQLLARPNPLAYLTPNPHILLCSSSTPPGAGVHGMCGYIAARFAVSRLRNWSTRPVHLEPTRLPGASAPRVPWMVSAAIGIGMALGAIMRRFRRNHSPLPA